MARQKRPIANGDATSPDVHSMKKIKTSEPEPSDIAPTTTTTSNSLTATPVDTDELVIQIVAGSYDRTLHGITVTIPLRRSSSTGEPRPSDDNTSDSIEFADTFLFNAHTSAIRCLALSPPSAPPKPSGSGTTTKGSGQKILLATGSSDERVNIYTLSAHPPSKRLRRRNRALSVSIGAAVAAATNPTADPKQPQSSRPPMQTRQVLENPSNREVGTLTAHSGAVTRLAFPTRGKLLSAAEDCEVCVTRTRDWTLLSRIRAPLPKSALKGRASGDAVATGAVKGINDFAVHGSLKVMISVGRGESCMRLWNLVTGKKAGVLEFEKGLVDGDGLSGKVSMTDREGKRVVWGLGTEDQGEEFAIAFDREVVVFGMDSKPRCRVMPEVPAGAGGAARRRKEKVHEIVYVGIGDDEELLVVSTEEGKVLFFSTRTADLEQPVRSEEGASGADAKGKSGRRRLELPQARLVGQLGGREVGVTGRIKDFNVLRGASGDQDSPDVFYVVTGSSDGAVRVWRLRPAELKIDRSAEQNGANGTSGVAAPRQVGELLGTYETQNRITCLEAFVMIPRPEGAEESEDESEDDDGGDEDDEFHGLDSSEEEEEEEEEEEDE